MDDLISKQKVIEVIDAVMPVDPNKSEYASGIACGAALAMTYVKQLPSAQPYTEEQIQTMQDLESAEIEKAYELGRESAQPEPQWIPYTERKPKNGQQILSCSEDGVLWTTAYNPLSNFTGAWMPLPEPWKGEQP